MQYNQMLEIIKTVSSKEKIEIINSDNGKENGKLLTFIYKGNFCYITDTGQLYLDRLSIEDKTYIEKIVIYAQRQAKIDLKLPIFNIDESNLEIKYINNSAYKKLMQIKNQCVFYRTNGIFGIEYILCEQKVTGNMYQYFNVAYYSDIRIVEQNLAKRTNLQVKPFNIFTNEELKTILYYIELQKDIKKSDSLLKDTNHIKKIIIEILQGEENGERTKN